MALTKTLKDAAYITVGLGVIGFQRAQVRRRELSQQLNTQLQETRGQVEKLAKDLEDRVEPVIGQFEERLPAPARDLVNQARDAAKDVQTQLRSFVNRNGNTPKSKAA
jgi:hypothetical protein